MRHKIAVVEDNPDNRLLVQALLEEFYEISEFETGVDAVRGLRADMPDLILLDISLPEMDGTEVLRWIRGQEEIAHVPVVALTAHAMSGDREKFLEYVGEAVKRHGIKVHTFCLITAHYHFLIKTPHANLSQAIKWINFGYCVYFNRKGKRAI